MYNSVVENIWQRIRDHFPADDEDTAAIATTSETKEGGNDDDNKNVVYHWLPVGINPRFRIFKYDDKSVYRRHLDGAWPCGALDERTNEFIVDTNALRLKNTANGENHHRATRLTFLIYLTIRFEVARRRFIPSTTPAKTTRKSSSVEPSRLASVPCCVFLTATPNTLPSTKARGSSPRLPPLVTPSTIAAVSTTRVCASLSCVPTSFSKKKPRRRRCC